MVWWLNVPIHVSHWWTILLECYLEIALKKKKIPYLFLQVVLKKLPHSLASVRKKEHWLNFDKIPKRKFSLCLRYTEVFNSVSYITAVQWTASRSKIILHRISPGCNNINHNVCWFFLLVEQCHLQRSTGRCRCEPSGRRTSSPCQGASAHLVTFTRREAASSASWNVRL